MAKLPNTLQYREVEEQYASSSKRPCLGLNQGFASREVLVQPNQYNLIPRMPLGLTVKKSPDFTETTNLVDSEKGVTNSENKNVLCVSLSNTSSLPALHFYASKLRIGHWEYEAKYEADLVVRCYFGKKKLMWEILQDGLKRKIEFQWSDVVSLKAEYPPDGKSGTLTIVLARKPDFYRETDLQPRKHTIWRPCPDFTDEQATIHRIHYIVCRPDILAKYYQKLIQCETLRSLSQQPGNFMSSPYFEQEFSAIRNPEELKGNECNQLSVVEKGSSSSSNCLEPSEVASLHPSMSTNEHTGNFISERMILGNIPSNQCHNMLDNIEDFFSDTQPTSGFDEMSLMTKVDSFSSLLQVPVLAPDQVDGKNHWESVNNSHSLSSGIIDGATSLEKGIINMDLSEEILSEQKEDGMQRKDSYEDLLYNLPRITSLPKLLT